MALQSHSKPVLLLIGQKRKLRLKNQSRPLGWDPASLIQAVYANASWYPPLSRCQMLSGQEPEAHVYSACIDTVGGAARLCPTSFIQPAGEAGPVGGTNLLHRAARPGGFGGWGRTLRRAEGRGCEQSPPVTKPHTLEENKSDGETHTQSQRQRETHTDTETQQERMRAFPSRGRVRPPRVWVGGPGS